MDGGPRSDNVRAVMATADDHHQPGELPEIRDEAADTPMWVPGIGLALLILAALFIVWQSASARLDAEATEAVEAPADAEGGAVEGAVEAADAENDDAPAEVVEVN